LVAMADAARLYAVLQIALRDSRTPSGLRTNGIFTRRLSINGPLILSLSKDGSSYSGVNVGATVGRDGGRSTPLYLIAPATQPFAANGSSYNLRTNGIIKHRSS
jgi:hypothetical protein